MQQQQQPPTNQQYLIDEHTTKLRYDAALESDSTDTEQETTKGYHDLTFKYQPRLSLMEDVLHHESNDKDAIEVTKYASETNTPLSFVHQRTLSPLSSPPSLYLKGMDHPNCPIAPTAHSSNTILAIAALLLSLLYLYRDSVLSTLYSWKRKISKEWHNLSSEEEVEEEEDEVQTMVSQFTTSASILERVCKWGWRRLFEWSCLIRLYSDVVWTVIEQFTKQGSKATVNGRMIGQASKRGQQLMMLRGGECGNKGLGQKDGNISSDVMLPELEEVFLDDDMKCSNGDFHLLKNSTNQDIDNLNKRRTVEYGTDIEPAFLNEEDYPCFWLTYDPILGIIFRCREEKEDKTMNHQCCPSILK